MVACLIVMVCILSLSIRMNGGIIDADEALHNTFISRKLPVVQTEEDGTSIGDDTLRLLSGTGDTVVLPHNREKIPPEVVVERLPDDKVVVNRRKLLEIEDYKNKYRRENEYATVYENYLDEPVQETAVCQVGSKLYYFGGLNETLFANFTERIPSVVALGTEKMWVYDMEDMSVTRGPDMPSIANHITCAEGPDGVLHITGGYRQDAKNRQEKAYRRHWAINITGPLSETRWEILAEMPFPRGAHGCKFLRDGKMYCIGGGNHQWGPFANDMMIYDPGTNSWELGPPMHDPRDHVMDLVTLWDGNALFVVGGRSHIIDSYPDEHKSPYFWTTAYSAEIYDIRIGKWKMVRAPATPRELPALVSWARHGNDKEPTVLIVGGQRYLGYSGHAINTVDEFDPNTGLYHCHEPLPFPFVGGAVGVWKGKMHIVGGGEWLAISATRRVMVVDLGSAPPPRNCYYKEEPVFDQWDRTYNSDPPFPGTYGVKDNRRPLHRKQKYRYHERLFKKFMLGLGKHQG